METDVFFPRHQRSVELISHCEFSLETEIPFPFSYEVIFIDKTNLHAARHFIAFAQNIRSRLALMRTCRKTYFRSRVIAKNNFSGIDISQGLDLERPSLSPCFLLVIHQTRETVFDRISAHWEKIWKYDAQGIIKFFYYRSFE